MRATRTPVAKIVHPYAWLWEPLEDHPTFVLRSMFGTKAAYIGGRITLCFCARNEPWHGVLVCTDHSHHESLRQQFPALGPHPILPKWLYLPDAHPNFESTAERLVARVRQHDPRIGIEPQPRKRNAIHSRRNASRKAADGKKPEKSAKSFHRQVS